MIDPLLCRFSNFTSTDMKAKHSPVTTTWPRHGDEQRWGVGLWLPDPKGELCNRSAWEHLAGSSPPWTRGYAGKAWDARISYPGASLHAC